jgi:hypothetical protein
MTRPRLIVTSEGTRDALGGEDWALLAAIAAS